ncbi:MAG: hypothetical protein A2Z20_02135 [Bdellovibrionales bacterium RBG_16_40_8]|nr:MAG: hypothetical protein A2Z20_02135 [Bdellovibrionales bacterium RBG_16_40_8]
MSQNYEYFGKYILLEKIAMGGMAEVWLARAQSAGGMSKFVAIKKILPQYSDNPEFIQMFKDEAAIAMNLSHSNIVSIYEFGQEKSQLFLVMDFVEGKNLRQILNKMKQNSQKFSTDQIVYIIKEVAAGLDHAHRSLNSATGKPLNITHRDMSPQNIMVTYEGETKVVDFGIAKAESQIDNTRTGTLKGKFGYMSPEQAEGLATDLRTDIFSLGICLWELLANERLFIAGNEISTLKKIRECNVPNLTKIDPNIHVELERITMKSLTRDRNLRYQTAAAMHRDLSRFINRQYPDFSPHDFSVFIKTLHSDEILDLRKHLIEYAKIPFRPTAAQNEEKEKSLITSFPQVPEIKVHSTAIPVTVQKQTFSKNNEQTMTETETFTASEPISDDQDNTEISISTPEGLAETNSKMSAQKSILDPKSLYESLQQKITVQPKMPRALVIDPNTDIDALSVDRPAQEVSKVTPMQSAKEKKDIKNKKEKIKSQRKATQRNSAMNIMIFVSCALITYLVTATYYPEQTKSILNFLGLKDEGSKGPEGHKDPRGPKDPKDLIPLPPPPPPPTITTSITINSAPSGADILIDGEITGKTTPSRVEVPLDAPFSLTLRLPRFLEYTRSNLTSAIAGKSFNATLQKATVAYLDIDVKPPTNAKIFINNRLLNDSLPISRYSIPAGVPIVVRAENTLTGVVVEETIQLKEDQRYKVLLNLDKNRTPSNRR